ncbi:hypothetical protein yc1106_01962 [Curvularia clavata]|uniref:Uncharacterized protein n=1 Tax=Curvularia clavata TaxID=95742 RepID=A0A9Q8Z6B2_CURCL|nr:hypothetical protein yc1106_01962 [Curvularia clavata]
MATLGTTFAGAALSLGGKKAEDPTTPPINAKSSEEESFVKCVDRLCSNALGDLAQAGTQGIGLVEEINC